MALGKEKVCGKWLFRLAPFPVGISEDFKDIPPDVLKLGLKNTEMKGQPPLACDEM